jgi:hypothetical protein
VRLSLTHRELAKILVQGHKHATFRGRLLEDFLVAGIAWPIAGPNHITSGRNECGTHAAPYACVQQNFHALASTNNGSTRSCPITRRAYAKLAWTSSGSSHGYPSQIVALVSPAASIPTAKFKRPGSNSPAQNSAARRYASPSSAGFSVPETKRRPTDCSLTACV